MVITFLVITSAMAVAACGSSSSAASAGASLSRSELKVSECMRSNGVPNFPDPSGGGGGFLLNGTGINHNRRRSCRPNGRVSSYCQAAARSRHTGLRRRWRRLLGYRSACVATVFRVFPTRRSSCRQSPTAPNTASSTTVTGWCSPSRARSTQARPGSSRRRPHADFTETVPADGSRARHCQAVMTSGVRCSVGSVSES